MPGECLFFCFHFQLQIYIHIYKKRQIGFIEPLLHCVYEKRFHLALSEYIKNFSLDVFFFNHKIEILVLKLKQLFQLYVDRVV